MRLELGLGLGPGLGLGQGQGRGQRPAVGLGAGAGAGAEAGAWGLGHQWGPPQCLVGTRVEGLQPRAPCCIQETNSAAAWPTPSCYESVSWDIIVPYNC